MHPEDREKILATYRYAQRMVMDAQAHPEKLGLAHAQEALRHAEKLLHDYGIKDEG